MTEREYTDEEIREMSKKEFRKSFPSGWMEISRFETLVLVIDALLESPPSREFTSAELGNEAGSSGKSVEKHLDKLVELGVVRVLEDRSPVRYSLNERNPITQRLYELNTTVQRVKEGDLPKSLTSSPQRKVINGQGNRWNDSSKAGTSKIGPSNASSPDLAAMQ